MMSVLLNHMSESELKDWLLTNYIDKKLSLPECSTKFNEEYGVSYSSSVFHNAMVGYGIDRRTISEAMCEVYYDGCSHLADPEISSVLDGLLLSDGSVVLKRFSCGSTCKEFLDYLASFLVCYGGSGVIEGEAVNKGRKKSNSLLTASHPDFEFLRAKWYYGEGEKKKVPRDLVLTPLTLKVWYYGDGSIVRVKSSNSCTLRLSTDGFDVDDVEFLVDILKRDLDIESKRTSSNRIRVSTRSIPDFFGAIGREPDFDAYSYKFDVEEWRFWTPMKRAAEKLGIDYYRLGHLVGVGAVECQRSTGGKKVMFTAEQMKKLEQMHIAGVLEADGRKDASAATKNKCRKASSIFKSRVKEVMSGEFPFVKLTDAQIVMYFNRLHNVPNDSLSDGVMKINRRETELCMHFHPHMFSVSVDNKMSPIDAFSNRNVMSDVVKKMEDERIPIEPDNLRRQIIEHNRVRRTSLFPVRAAKTVLNMFGVDGMSILDPCAGFSSRLLGFYACDYSDCRYTGIEPLSSTVDGLRNTVSSISSMRPDDSVSIIHGCAESEMPNLESESFDLIFTSPPYFKYEKYSDDETQSHIRFSEYEDWLEYFLFNIIRESERVLKPSGIMVVAIKNIGGFEIGDHFELYSRMKFEQLETIKMRLPSQWYDSTVEPLFIFRKPE